MPTDSKANKIGTLYIPSLYMGEDSGEFSDAEKEILRLLKANDGVLEHKELLDKTGFTAGRLSTALTSLTSSQSGPRVVRKVLPTAPVRTIYILKDSEEIATDEGKNETTRGATQILEKKLNLASLERESRKHITQTIASFQNENLYLKELYVERRDLNNAFAEFARGDQVIFAVVGETGLGKTSFLCDLASTIEHDIVVFLQGGSLTDEPLEKQIMDRIASSYSIDNLLEVLATEGKTLFLFFDALNDFGPGKPERQRILINEFNNLIYHSRGARLKMIITSRPYSWRLVSDKLPRDKCYTSQSGLQFQLLPFDEQNELKLAYDLYRNKNELKSGFTEISEVTRKNMRTPGLLRMISEAYKGKRIPAIAPAEKVFDLYYRKVILREDDIGTSSDESSETDGFVKLLVDTMLSKKRGYLTRDEVYNIYLDENSRDSSAAILSRLLDAGFIRSVMQPYNGYKFTYDWVFENLLAQRIVRDLNDNRRLVNSILEYSRHARSFQYLYGALKSLLVRNNDPSVFLLFAKQSIDNSDGQRILVEAVLALSDYFPERANLILKTLAEDRNGLSKELACRIISEMRDPDITSQLELIMSSSANQLDIVLESILLSWYKSNTPYPPVLDSLMKVIIRQLDIRRPMEAAIEITLRSFSVITQNPTRMTLLRGAWKDCYLELMVKPTATIKNKIKRTIIQAGINRADPFLKEFGMDPNDRRLMFSSIGPMKLSQTLHLLKYFKDDTLEVEEKDFHTACELVGSTDIKFSISGVAFTLFVFLTGRAFENNKGLVLEALHSKDQRRRSATIASLGYLGRGNPEVAKVLISDEFAGEVVNNPLLFRGQLYDILAHAKDHEGDAPLATRIIEASIGRHSANELPYIINVLSKVGLIDPKGVSQALLPLVTHSDEEIRNSVVAAVQRMRIKEPDILEKYFDSAPQDFKSHVRLMKNNLGTRELVVSDAFAFGIFFVPEVRRQIARIIEMVAPINDLHEFKIATVNHILDLFQSDELFDAFTRTISENTRPFKWSPSSTRTST